VIPIASLRRAACRAALLLAALGSAATHAAEPACPPPPAPLTPEQVHAGMREARDHGFLWRVRRNGVTSHLYGTVHVARLAWMFPGPRVQAALKAADTIALELDPLDAEIQRRMAEGMAARAGPEFPAPLRERMAERLRAECLPETAFEHMGPEMQIALLTITAARRDGLEPAYGIDLFLAGFARGLNKPVVSLETPQEQLRAIVMPDPRDALAVVDAGLAELEAGRARPALMRVAQVWADADYDALMRYDDWCECRRTEAESAVMKRLLDERNPALAERIAALHARGKALFVAIGSLHMVGPVGLPALLAQRGFTVERVEYTQ
jgi:uncharacterized protein YbaP (TraB family)